MRFFGLLDRRKRRFLFHNSAVERHLKSCFKLQQTWRKLLCSKYPEFYFINNHQRLAIKTYINIFPSVTLCDHSSGTNPYHLAQSYKCNNTKAYTITVFSAITSLGVNNINVSSLNFLLAK